METDARMLAMLDATVLDELNTIPGITEMLIALFVDQTPLLFDDLSTALVQHDVLTARILAHRLKGSSAVLGSLRLAFLCETLDAFLGVEPLPVVTALVQQMQDEYQLFADALCREWVVAPRPAGGSEATSPAYQARLTPR